MKKIILIILALGSLSLFSLDKIELEVGQSTLINGETVSCHDTNNSIAKNAYMQIPYAHQVIMLKFGGIGSCYIDSLQENILFLYTNRHPSGLRISIDSGYMINEALKAGDCGI